QPERRKTVKTRFTLIGMIGFWVVSNAGLAFGAVDLDVWQWRNPLPSGNSLFAVAFGGNTFVVAGELGAASRSADGLEWLTVNTGITNTRHGMAYGNGLFVMVGDGGSIATSPDGESWTARASGTANPLWSVAFGNGTFVAVGSASTAVTSMDGVNW